MSLSICSTGEHRVHSLALATRRAVTWCTVASMVPAATITAQTGRVSGSCETCRIEVHHVSSLGEKGETDAGTAVLRTSGGYLFVSRYHGTEVQLFGDDGAPVRVIGRQGQGPGEFQRIQGIALGPLDSVLALDASGRVGIWSSDGVLRRTLRIPPTFISPIHLVWTDSILVVGTSLGAGPSARFALNAVRLDDDTIVESFGYDPAEWNPESAVGSRARRPLAKASDGGFWAAHVGSDVGEYRIERYDASRRLVKEFRVDADWFRRSEASGLYGTPPNPSVLDVLETADGLLVVLLQVTDPEWTSALSRWGAEGGKITSYTKYLDSVIDVIEPARVQRVATLRLDEWASFLLPGPRVTVWNEADYRLDVRSISILR